MPLFLKEKVFNLNSINVSLRTVHLLNQSTSFLSDDLIEGFVSLFVDEKTFLMPFISATKIFIHEKWPIVRKVLKMVLINYILLILKFQLLYY